MQILGFSIPIYFSGHFEEIGIAKVLLCMMDDFPRRVGKFWDVSFPTSEKVPRGKKKNAQITMVSRSRYARVGDHNKLLKYTQYSYNVIVSLSLHLTVVKTLFAVIQYRIETRQT